MSEPVDVIKTLLPFASAIVELDGKLDALADLNSQLDASKKELDRCKQEAANAKATTEAAIKATADAKAEAERHVAERNAEIATNHSQSMAAIQDARNKAAEDAKALLDNAQTNAAAHKADAEQIAAATIAKAQADAQSLADEHADLTEKTVAARSEYATAKQLLDDIKAKLDQHRGL